MLSEWEGFPCCEGSSFPSGCVSTIPIGRDARPVSRWGERGLWCLLDIVFSGKDGSPQWVHISQGLPRESATSDFPTRIFAPPPQPFPTNDSSRSSKYSRVLQQLNKPHLKRGEWRNTGLVARIYPARGAGARFDSAVTKKETEPEADNRLTRLQPGEGEGGKHLGTVTNAGSARGAGAARLPTRVLSHLGLFLVVGSLAAGLGLHHPEFPQVWDARCSGLFPASSRSSRQSSRRVAPPPLQTMSSRCGGFSSFPSEFLSSG